MQGLIQKSGYIKPGGGAGHYAEYIGTRDGVELMNAGDQYLKYIAERPRSHGLFSNVPNTDLEKTMQEVSSHSSPVWTFIYSLKREDAARLGYNSAESWRKLLLAHQTEPAEAMKIPPNQFRWCAAFHDEKHHPHIHLMAWSADPKQGYLTEQGIETMRSKLTNDIFQDELLHLYKQKDLSYQEVRDTAQEAMRDLIREMKSGICDCPVIEDKLFTLAEILQDTKGKKVYGYLKKPVKAQVDAVVDELARLPAVAECYEVWNKLRDELENYYKDKPREHLPLSQQKEFKSIKNMVIREAERIQLGEITFEDEQMDDMQDEEVEVLSLQTNWQMVNAHREAKFILCDDDSTWVEQEEAVQVLEQLWDAGLSVAAHQLGKCWRDGLGVLPDDEKAELWFRRSAETGYDFSQYALGKLLQNRKRIKEAVNWFEKAATQGNQYASYWLGKLYLLGDGVPKDTEKAIEHLTQAAKSGNQYAQYALGKLYLDRQDEEQAHYWFTQSAAQGNEYAQFFLARWDCLKPPSVMLSVTRLLHHIGIEGCKAPPIRRKEMQLLTREELQRLLIQAREEGYYEVFLLELTTGLRVGELMALQWDDLNFKTGELRIERQVYRTRDELLIQEPKTKALIRTVILPPPVVEALKEYKKIVSSRWIFPSPKKEDAPLAPAAASHRLSKILIHAGCKKVRFHDLRHVFATNALEHGMDVKTLSTIIGHISSATTLNVYAHVTDDMQKQAATKIDQGIGKVETSMEKSQTTANCAMTDFKAQRGKRRYWGSGFLGQIKGGRWAGRYTVKWSDGRKETRSVYADIEEECEKLLAEMITAMKMEVAAKKERLRTENRVG